MCFTQGSTTSLSTIETPAQPSTYLSLIPPGPQPPVTPYSPDGGHFYTPAPPVFPGLDVRPRLGSNSTAGQGMAHAHRSTTLPHPGTHLSARELYTSATPAFRRPDHHIPRSPPFSSPRRHNPLSPTSTSAGYGSVRMDTGYAGSNKTQQSVPPLLAMTSLGRLSYGDASATPIKVDINGVIDKGFFIAENEWTCYRRNYFSCVCSFSLAPMMHNTPIHFLPTGSTQAYNVYGFAMCISAVVSDNDNHTIDLVQHTPKRDKGPIAKPEKVRLSPKPPPASHHPLSNLYAGPDGSLGSSRYEQQGFGQPTQQGSAPTEHTFERIQFKQATANNGKRRAAQQYYHLVVELWADVGQQGGSDQWVKVAYRKSAKMIVRGRSPGHYQSERRGSTSSGPGGSGGSIGGSGYSSGVLGPNDYSGSSSMLGGGGGYGQHYDVRHSGYGGGSGGGTRHHHELAMEPMISAEEVKAITDTKGYQYYPATIYEGEQQDTRHHHHHHHQHHHQQQQHQQQVELFSHSGRHDASESGTTSSVSTAFDPTKGVKSEMESNGLPSLFYHSGPYYSQRCGRFDGKSTSTGQYPTLLQPPSTTMSMT